MLETTFPKKLLALALGLVVGGLVAVGCVDNSGNKTYPRADSGSADAGDDVSVSDDAATGNDAPAADAPAADAPTRTRRRRTSPPSDGSASDGPKSDVSAVDASASTLGDSAGLRPRSLDDWSAVGGAAVATRAGGRPGLHGRLAAGR